MSHFPPPLPAPGPVGRAVRLVQRWLWHGVAVGIMALVISHVAWRTSNGQAVRRHLAEARARGEPVSIAEVLAAYPGVAEPQNAYVALAAVWETEDPALWKAFREGASAMPDTKLPALPKDLPILGKGGSLSHTGALTGPQRSALLAFIDSDAERHQRIRSALERPGFRAPLRLELGLETPLPHLRAMKTEGQRLRAWSLAHAENGKPLDAARELSDLARLGHGLRTEPVLISQLVRIALYEMTLAGMERLLATVPADPATLAELQRIAESLHALDSLPLSLVSERAVGLAAFESGSATDILGLVRQRPDESADAVESHQQNMKITMGMLDVLGFRRADQRLFLETHAELLRRTAQPDGFQGEGMAPVFERVKTESRKIPPRIFSSLLLPALGNALSKFGENEARRRCALVALAMERARRDRADAATPSLESVVSGLPPGTGSDPFTGGALKVRETPGGFVVYSVGPNGRDDRAQFDRKADHRGRRPDYDVGFRVERGAGATAAPQPAGD